MRDKRAEEEIKKENCPPTVSVIMGVYNQKDEGALRAAVDSILGQTFSDFEFIIWDDGSDRDAAALLQSQKERDERIILAGESTNHGLAHSLNACIRLARGRFIARMDADDISRPERLEKQVNFLLEHKGYAWCGTNAVCFDENGIWGSRKMPEVPGKRDFLKFSPFIHPTVVFRKGIFEEHRGYLEYEETLRCEDYEIFMRLYRKGLRGYNIQEDLFCYREDDGSYKRRTFKNRMNESKLRFRNFKKMGLLFPAGWIFCIRPIIGRLLPGAWIGGLKRMEASRVAKQKKETI